MRKEKLAFLGEQKCLPPEQIPPAREPTPPPPPSIGSQVSPAEDLFRSTSCRVEKLEKKDDSGDHMHEALNSATQTASAIKILCFMEWRSNITAARLLEAASQPHAARCCAGPALLSRLLLIVRAPQAVSPKRSTSCSRFSHPNLYE